MASHAHDAHGAHDGPHITPLPIYFGVFGALLVLTVVTVWIAKFDFGAANTLIAMAVATVKATLVAAIFMHLLYDERLNVLAFVFGLLFVSLFFIFTMLDVFTRKHIDPMRANGGIEAAAVDELRLEVEKAKEAKPAPVYVDEAAVPEDERSVVKPVAPAAPATEATKLELNLLFSNGKAIVAGQVGSDALMNEILGAAKAAVGDSNVVSRLKLDKSLPPTAPWMTEVSTAFKNTKDVRELRLVASPTAVTVSGRVEDEATRAQVAAALTQGIKSVPLKNQIRVKPAGDEALDRFKAFMRSMAGKNLYFAPKSDVVADTAKSALGKVTDIMADMPTVGVEIGVHTSATSGEDVALTQKQANALKAWLVQQGTDGARIVAKGYGSKKQIKGASAESNRRVEYTVLDAAGKAYGRKMLVEMVGDKIQIYKKIYFNTGKDTIKTSSLKMLDKVAEVFLAHPEIKQAEIQGYTDASGNAEKNKQLSQRRAESVRKYLIKDGVTGDRLTAVGYGSAKPIESNDTAAGREANRRVEFKILKQ